MCRHWIMVFCRNIKRQLKDWVRMIRTKTAEQKYTKAADVVGLLAREHAIFPCFAPQREYSPSTAGVSPLGLTQSQEKQVGLLG